MANSVTGRTRHPSKYGGHSMELLAERLLNRANWPSLEIELEAVAPLLQKWPNLSDYEMLQVGAAFASQLRDNWRELSEETLWSTFQLLDTIVTRLELKGHQMFPD